MEDYLLLQIERGRLAFLVDLVNQLFRDGRLCIVYKSEFWWRLRVQNTYPWFTDNEGRPRADEPATVMEPELKK